MKGDFLWIDLAVVLLEDSMAEDWSGWEVPEEVKPVFFERLDVVDSHHIVYLETWDSGQDYAHKDSNDNDILDGPQYFLFWLVDMLTLLVEGDLLLSTLFEPQHDLFSLLDIWYLSRYSFIGLLIVEIAEI